MMSRTFRVVILSLSALLFTTYILLPSHASYLGSESQHPLAIPESAKRVAVIGAGAAGSSAAYFLRDYADKNDIPVNITLFERNNYIGGRTTTVHAYDDIKEPVELGASIFVEVNKNLYDAAQLFGLPTVSFETGSPDGADKLGVWDGKEFVLILKDGGWWETIKMLWRYGLSPVRTQNLMKKVIGQFLKMYDAPVFPWKSLTQTAMDLELTAATTNSALLYLKANNINPPFTTELIQASTRVNYAANLGHIHGLEAMVCMATDNAMAVLGGNWRIFDKMAQNSRANIHLETRVTNIERIASKKTWTVKYIRKDSEIEEELEDEYDEVIIATPYQFSNITSASIKAPEVIKYVNMHVTLFASPHRLSPKYFNSDKEMLPDMILTTLPSDYDQTSDNVGPSRFYSVNILRTVERTLENGVKRQEYIYKIFSPEHWDDEKIHEMMALPADSKALTWTYRKLWQSYPVEQPRAVFQEQQLDFGLWYTAGMEAFISTMETMSLAGKNVAANIVEAWVSARLTAQMHTSQHDEST